MLLKQRARQAVLMVTSGIRPGRHDPGETAFTNGRDPCRNTT
jgi:hypothetical protein